MTESPEGNSKENSKSLVNSVKKVFAVLRAFDTTLPELTISDVAKRANFDRGTAFRMINTLVHLGYLAPVPRSRRFRLTLKCLELGYTPLARNDLKTHARPLLQELIPDHADAASLGMLDGPEVVYVERVQSEAIDDTLDRRIGSRIGAYAAALGQVILAYLPVDEQIQLLEGTPRVKLSERTLIDLDRLLERLQTVRRQGFAVSDGENAYGLRSIAAPILDTDGAPVAGISMTVRATRTERDAFVADATPHILRVAAELTKAVRLTSGSIVSNPFQQKR
jgi:IclR family transcriptional regulator, pca regulon regulatory protein